MHIVFGDAKNKNFSFELQCVENVMRNKFKLIICFQLHPLHKNTLLHMKFNNVSELMTTLFNR